MSPTWTNARARRANAIQRGDAEAAAVALQDLKAARLEDHIRADVDTLTEAQRVRLATQLLSARRTDEVAA
jgi:hypothetical protein